MKRKLKLKRRKVELLDLDITSLLDILVILLVFLLKSYNASDLNIDLEKAVRLPLSQAKAMGNHAAIIQITRHKKISINNREIGNITNFGQKITPLFVALKKIKHQEDLMLTGNKKNEPKNINIVLDQDIEYSDMKKVMHTASLVGYTNFKFIVRGNY
jgi:biopolymer transport protein ExbD